ncbi:MAG TPA: thioredoxin [Bacillota bacterium]|nr:thioredoxin [Bacillota bacterium]
MAESVNELSEKEFNDFIKDELVVVDFYADWCMPCVMMAPVLEELNKKFKGKIKFGKVNIDDNQELAKKFKILSIPNFILFRKGVLKEQFVGGIPLEEFEEKLKKYL